MSADVYLYTGEVNPEDVRLRSGVLGAISVTLVGVAAVAAIGTGTIKASVPVSGVAASPAIGTGAFRAKVTFSGVSATPAIGSVRFSVKTPITGVAASPAIGSVTFNARTAISGVAAAPAVGVSRIDVATTLGSVAAEPAIGVGTVTTASAGAVIVALEGVGADPQIGDGTVEIEEVVVPPEQGLVAGGGRWFWPKEEFVYLTGVAASPAVGKITPIAKGTLDDLAKRYPFPRQPAPERIPRIAARRKAQEKPAPISVVVSLTGVQSVCGVGTGTVKRVVDLLDDEVMGLLEMLELEEAA